jgi:hypothetical protein
VPVIEGRRPRFVDDDRRAQLGEQRSSPGEREALVDGQDGVTVVPGPLEGGHELRSSREIDGDQSALRALRA